MLEQKFRHYYQSILVNPVIHLLKDRISPIKITYLAGVVGVCIIPALYFQQTIVAVLLLLISAYADTLDGSLARLQNSVSDFGTVLDIMMDRLVEFATVFGLYLVAPGQRGFWCLLMLGSILLCITSFLIVGIFTPNSSEKSFHYSPGLIERAEAIIFFILMIFLPNYFSILAAVFTVLVLWTALVRLRQFHRQVKIEEKLSN